MHFGVLDHDHGISAAWNHPSGSNRYSPTPLDHRLRHDSRVNHFFVEPHATRNFLGRAEGVFGNDGEAVHVRAIERRHIHERDDVGRKHPAEGRLERRRFDPARREIDGRTKPPLRFVAVEHIEKLLLLRHRATLPRQRLRRSPHCRQGR